MGSPLDSPLQRIYETPHLRRIGRSFAIAVKELTYAEIQRFPNSGYVGTGNLPAAPVHYVSWYVAVAYCNWLSEQEGLPKDQWCYEPNDKGEYAVGMKPAENYLERTGYRLPTEAEWEFACRGGATTSYAFGDDLASLRHYAWYDLSAKLEETPLTELAPRTRTEAGLLAVLERMLHDRSWAMPVGRLKPNDLGLFDVHGNLLEWCDSPYTVYPIVGEMAVDDAGTLEVVNDQNLRVLRGGAFSDDPLSVRSAARNQTKPALWDIYRGFRVARTYPSTLPHP
jgi:hypothetical protein